MATDDQRAGEDAMDSDEVPMWQRPLDEQLAARRPVVELLGSGWVETGFFPFDRYRFIKRSDGWACFTHDEQQAGWDQEHGLG